MHQYKSADKCNKSKNACSDAFVRTGIFHIRIGSDEKPDSASRHIRRNRFCLPPACRFPAVPQAPAVFCLSRVCRSRYRKTHCLRWMSNSRMDFPENNPGWRRCHIPPGRFSGMPFPMLHPHSAEENGAYSRRGTDPAIFLSRV